MIRSLVVEDNMACRQYLLELLRQLDVSALAANNSEEAQDLIQGQSVDLMLIDIALGPGMNGADLCKHLKQNAKYAKTPAIAVTAFPRNAIKEMGDEGFSDLLEKPYSLSDLKQTIEKYTKQY